VRWGPQRQIYSTSTPEGFKFLYDFFVTKAAPDRKTIHASSFDNPFLDKEYLETMRKNYTEAQWKVWALGQFGNLNTSLVYSQFDRVKNHTDLLPKDNPLGSAFHIGMDFNIDNMAAVTHIIKEGLPYAVDEIVKIKDVPTMITEIKRRYPRHPVIIYPDASGNNRNPAGIATSHTLLKQAGFQLRVNPSNPGVGDRINSMNAMFCNSQGERRYKVNTKQCPTYTSSLERQGWVKGEPDKSNNIDHPVDAGGYFIYQNYPIQGRPTLRTL
jgi:hypothetical protein